MDKLMMYLSDLDPQGSNYGLVIDQVIYPSKCFFRTRE